MITFADLARGGRSNLLALFDECVAKWHESESTEPLHVWLGLTESEYAVIVERPHTLSEIFASGTP